MCVYHLKVGGKKKHQKLDLIKIAANKQMNSHLSPFIRKYKFMT